MKITSARVTRFRNFEDSTDVGIQPDVTALVGKNESGKTAFLQALHRLNPVNGEKFDELDHYPRWLYTKDRKAGGIGKAQPIVSTFDLEPDDVAALAERFGEGTFTATQITAGRRYDNTWTIGWTDDPDESKAVEYLIAEAELEPTVAPRLGGVVRVDALVEAIKELQQPEEADRAPDSEAVAAAGRLRSVIGKMLGKSEDLPGALRSALVVRIPKFFYFGEYSFLGGRTDLRHLFQTPDTDLKPAERTALALLRLAGADDEALLQDDYERRKAELEAVSNDLTDEMADYWSQSADLEVLIDVDKETVSTSNGQRAVARNLEIRVKDRRHGHTDNIDKRSNGFRWFFSFLAAFSEFEGRDDRIVILLDEPGLTLHATAQRDLLRFIEERLATKHQVIFTTHSPFLVQPGRLERARLVEDKGARTGSRVTEDVFVIDKDTLFPLQAALGYDIAQNLFVAPHNLLLEGTSDYTYLNALSNHLECLGREGLDARWSLLPVGGVTKITTFLALLGQHLAVTVLVDGGRENKAVADLVGRGLLDKQRFITPSQVIGTKEADIEDLFTVEDYLSLYNSTFGGTPLASDDLTGDDRIVKRIARKRGPFSHGDPANHLLRHRDEVLPKLSDGTLDRFECLIARINATIPAATAA